MTLSRVSTVTILLTFISAAAGAQNISGNLEIHEFESTVFDNTRKLRVWLPPGYHDQSNENRQYPVLCLNDGQNLFDANTALFGNHEWKADEAASELIESEVISPLIIVGIDNAGRRGRAREYLPYPDEFLDPPEPNPQGFKYPKFLKSEVIPFIERKYRVDTAKSGRVLGGSSYGALIAAYVAFSNPDLFSGLLLESPSFYVNDNQVLNFADSNEVYLDRIYMRVGTNELGREDCAEHPGNQEAVNGVKEMSNILQQKGLVEGVDLSVNIEPCAKHTELAWARRLPAALEFLYGFN